MSQIQTQMIEIFCVAIMLSAGVLFLSRRGKISFRYTIGWLALFSFIAMGSPLISKIETITDLFKVSPTALFAAFSFLLLLMLCIQLSISISGLQRQLRKFNEDVALQKKEIDDLRDSRQ